ncbi:hypothetical protein QA640_04635 [Bradyrhizobium sp. CB82]|uniref:hypothetical protein n=1 Tax=Bradyrhizobium sp. CB82 TaxID=3039159 RepID=UPI0024B04ADA|nr:hypothetical protein [Bradyrhizobium sp. CB82]WFU41802.1 hypothetical protein QA640_04635 [Bradyrhizobium sp. CB82]
MRLILAFFLLLLSPLAYSQACSCGPDYCQSDARYPKLLAKKKASLSASYPSDLVGLLDRDGACVARVEQAPDGFSLMTVGSDGNKLTIAWDEDNERISRQQVMDGVARAYYKFNTARRFSCCNEPNYDAQPDWDANLGLNTGIAIACTISSSGVVCQ